MPRAMNFFRFENASKDSGLSFHCCGKPSDLIDDEPLDLINGIRRTRKEARPSIPEERGNERQFDSLLVATLCNEHRLVKERKSVDIMSPTPSGHWTLQSFFFWSTPSGSNSKHKPRIKKFWSRKPTESLIGTTKKEAGCYGTSDEISHHKQLRSVRSMPLLSNLRSLNSTANRTRCQSRCRSQMSFSGFDRLMDDQDQEISRREESATDLSHPETHHISHNDREKGPHSARLSKSSRVSSFLSMGSWSNLLVNRQQKEGKDIRRCSIKPSS